MVDSSLQYCTRATEVENGSAERNTVGIVGPLQSGSLNLALMNAAATPGERLEKFMGGFDPVVEHHGRR
jgi:hypothetical protein